MLLPRRTHAAVALFVLLLSACTSGTAEDQGKDGLALGQDVDPGVAHVHGLGVDPADGVLYAATHYGLFRLPEQGKPERVAARFQDTMGFTVVGPKTFLGSGHPDFRKDPQLPPLLGLIRSTDAAETWKNISLSGESDFHALHSAHGKVYGWDATSGRFMVSSDAGATWDTRSVTTLRDFAVDPKDPDSILATTELGPVRSADGGRSWKAVEGAPRLVVLAWGDALYGVDIDGVVHRSATSGRTWFPAGGVGGQPEAIGLSTQEGVQTLYVAVSGRGILASTDAGQSFTTRYAE